MSDPPAGVDPQQDLAAWLVEARKRQPGRPCRPSKLLFIKVEATVTGLPGSRPDLSCMLCAHPSMPEPARAGQLIAPEASDCRQHLRECAGMSGSMQRDLTAAESEYDQKSSRGVRWTGATAAAPQQAATGQLPQPSSRATGSGSSSSTQASARHQGSKRQRQDALLQTSMRNFGIPSAKPGQAGTLVANRKSVLQAAARWMACTGAPLSTVENPHFRQMQVLLNSEFVWPGVSALLQ